MFPNASRAILLHVLLGFNSQVSWIDSFSPSFPVPRSSTRNVRINNIHERDTHLFMSLATAADETEDLTPGTVVTKRYLHRFSPTDSAIQTPYTIEERQKYSVREDKSLVSLGDKSLILRGGVSEEGEGVASTGMPVTSVGPSLHTIEGLKMDSTDLIPQSWGSSYTMALFSNNIYLFFHLCA